MNAVEIEQAITELAEQPFSPEEFPFAFLAAFGNKSTTVARLRSGTTNKSDVGGVLQTNNIHLKVADSGTVGATLTQLRDSPATQNQRHRVRYLLATDGVEFEAEDLATGETVACDYADFPDHFGFLLPLAGITTVKQIQDSLFDIQATARLNRLYVALLRDNPEWSDEGRRPDMDHFMARLIFCFFAEDTDIFKGDDLFTGTVDRMSDRDGSNTHDVIGEIFRAMNTRTADRAAEPGVKPKLPRWANIFPYVNGDLFSGSTETPRFSKIARRYLLHIGALDWTRINPDIFGSMIQAVADEEERGDLGVHYTSVPNILKVLNPLFLDDLREALEKAKSPRKLLNLRKRMSNIRVFDPACGSGNFLVIAYKEMRTIEAEINERRGEAKRPSDIPLTNFRGIEIRGFSAEIARLALIIAEFQCDVRYRGPKNAKEAFLPLDAQNWITSGNALRLDWLSICPPTGSGVKLLADDLFETPLDQAEIDFETDGGETYICGNPPYRGSTYQSGEQKADLERIFGHRIKGWKSLDYVAGWFMKAADYGRHAPCTTAFVTTNSICQGQQVPIIWPRIFAAGHEIAFAHTSFKWANLASHNAGVTVAIVGISNHASSERKLYSLNDAGGGKDEVGETEIRNAGNINAYLVTGPNVFVHRRPEPLANMPPMLRGNMPVDGGHLLFDPSELKKLALTDDQRDAFVREALGSEEFIRGQIRYCLWIEDDALPQAMSIPFIADRIEAVRKMRLASKRTATRDLANRAHQFSEMHCASERTIIVPGVSSAGREYLQVGVLGPKAIPTNLAFALYDAPLWTMALLASRLHLVWIDTVCGKLKTDYRYSNTLGWNTFPVPRLTEKHRADLIQCAEDILLAREAHFPTTIADLYVPEKMPESLRAAHDHNDEVLERVYIGRRFKNDAERLERLFEMYTKMTRHGAAR